MRERFLISLTAGIRNTEKLDYEIDIDNMSYEVTKNAATERQQKGDTC